MVGGVPMSAADEFFSLFDAEGRFRAGEGSVDVVFLTNTGRRYPGRLTFKGGLCVSADMEGSSRWAYPDGAPLSGLRLLLSFNGGEPVVVFVHEGRLRRPEGLPEDARLADARARAADAAVRISERAR